MERLYAICHESGGMTKFEWERDPKRLCFILARYKTVARMLEGKARVLEVGCADGFGSRIVRQQVGELVAMDIDRASIAEAVANDSARWPVDFRTGDVQDLPITERFDAVYCLDVLEHIEPQDEARFLACLRSRAPVAIIGSPSLESQPYASELSRKGHVNCKTGHNLKASLMPHWNQVFLFGMNDETLHTGFAPMAHYRMALCVA
jgi:SAM-dependent methyltransferase